MPAHAVACGDGGHSSPSPFLSGLRRSGYALASCVRRSCYCSRSRLSAPVQRAARPPALSGSGWTSKGVTHYSDQPVPGATKRRSARGQRRRRALRGTPSSDRLDAARRRQPPRTIAPSRSVQPQNGQTDRQHRRRGQRRDPHRAGAAAAAHAESVSGRQAGRRASRATRSSYALTERAARHAQRESPSSRISAGKTSSGDRARSSSPCGRNRSRNRRSVPSQTAAAEADSRSAGEQAAHDAAELRRAEWRAAAPSIRRPICPVVKKPAPKPGKP